MATFEVRTNVPYAVIGYGNRINIFEKTADSHGVARFEWPDFAVYVNAQKTDCFFSDKIILQLPAARSWGQTSGWYLASRFNPIKKLYGLHRLDVSAERLLKEAEIARRKAEEEARKLREAAEAEATRLAEELRKHKLAEDAEKIKESIVVAVDPVTLEFIQKDYNLYKLYKTDPSTAISEARDRLATIKVKEVTEVAGTIGAVRVVLKTMGCWYNVWTPAVGKWWACRGTSSQNVVKVCMRNAPGLKCPGGECRSVEPSPKSATEFTGGYKLQAIRTGGSGLERWGEVMITPPFISDNGIPGNGIPDIRIPISRISKTLIVKKLPSSVFKGDTRTIVGAVDVDGLPITGELVVMKVDGVAVNETSTVNGVFSFRYTFDKAGSRKFIFESPATDKYPDYGRAVERVSVSGVPLEHEERLRVEREEYAARREALKGKRIVIPKEYEYKPIFRRDELVTPEREIEPEIPPAEPEPPIPTRGSIQVDLPVPPVPGQLIEVPVAVWLDDIFRGNAPTTIDNVRVGSHIIVLKMAGFVSSHVDVEVREGEVTSVSGIKMILQ